MASEESYNFESDVFIASLFFLATLSVLHLVVKKGSYGAFVVCARAHLVFLSLVDCSGRSLSPWNTKLRICGTLVSSMKSSHAL